MSSPVWKIYSAGGEYVAATKDVEDAACLVAFRGEGATIRYDHGTVVWREGSESQAAAESYDYVATVAWGRIRKVHQRSMDRLQAAREAYAASTTREVLP